MEKTIVSKQQHAYIRSIVVHLGTLLDRKGYTKAQVTTTLNERLANPKVLVIMAQQAFECGLTPKAAAATIFKTIGF